MLSDSLRCMNIFEIEGKLLLKIFCKVKVFSFEYFKVIYSSIRETLFFISYTGLKQSSPALFKNFN